MSASTDGYPAVVAASRAMAAPASAANASEVELMRTILGEQVPQSVILACLNACAFDVTAALNWYFMEVASHEAEHAGAADVQQGGEEESMNVPIIQSGLAMTLHSRFPPGMIAKTDTYYATLTRGLPSYDMLTPSNEKFMTIRLRKRGWMAPNLVSNGGSAGSLFSLLGSSQPTPPVSTIQRPSFMNGDIVTLECNGLWLRASSLNKMLQWKSPADDDRCKFVIRGLPLGRSLRPGDYFFLTSYKWEDKEIVMREERPVGISSYNTSMHRCFLGLGRVKTPGHRFYLYAKLTDNAVASLPQPGDPVDIRHLTVSVAGTPVNEHQPSTPTLHKRDSLTDEISQTDAKIDQMVGIVGDEISRDRLANFLDGAGGDVQVALEHYFMTLSTAEPPPAPAPAIIPPPPPVVIEPAPEVAAHHRPRRPMSDLIIPIPEMLEPLDSPSAQILEPPIVPVVEEVDPYSPAVTRLSTTRSRRGTSADSLTLEGSLYSRHEEHEALTIHDFEMVSVLGKGSFGAVMLVRFKKDGRIFALKIIKKTNMDKADIRNAMEERQILQRINHPYICSLVFAFQTNERLYLGMKYYAAGDLFYHLNMRGQLRVKDAQLYSAELVLAISYLHELNILYRDLKPSNVMIDSDGHIGVVDFGLSKQHIYGSSHGVKTLSGTAEYVAPEALTQMEDGSRSYGKAYDWWSLGIVLYEMLVGESPFYDKNEHKMLRKIAYADAVFPPDFPREALDLVRGLLCKDPSRRLGSERMGGVEAIKSDRFFRGIDWEKLARREIPANWKPKLTSETDTRYVDPEFIDEGPPSAAYDPSVGAKKTNSRRFSQFSFNINFS
ncbi:hypothetical protein Poli38472_013078 [Pythium oligandrum]|uniref:Uncharacterized protein n=1 Tax=Pythium oligandrum TaxID=41045 RepID=A0A8K1FJ22_PYTOL|nr:hypothetical protein Poli38472_013078 [Pythium oligandrum]|eukprot:TMW64456.1 hypothetical protein Poli38472_013078 [Pythium oligandrum]